MKSLTRWLIGKRYISDIDIFLHHLNHKLIKSSAQRAEIIKYQRLASLRDYEKTNKTSLYSTWKEF